MFHPFYYVLIYVALVYLRPQEYVEDLKTIPVLPIVLGLSFVYWLFAAKKNFEAPQHRLLPIFLVAMMMSLVANDWMGGALKVLTEFAPTLLLFYLIGTTTDTLGKLRLFTLVLVMMSLVLALHGIDQMETGVGWTGAKVVEGNRITYLGIFNDPNDLALALIMSIPMLGYHFRYWRNGLIRAGLLVTLALILYGVYLTNSRGGIVALLFLAGLYSLQRFGVFRTAMFSFLALPVLVFAPSRFGALDAGESSAAGRVDAWYEGVQMFLHQPWFGVGKGNFIEHHHLTAHNSFVLVFAETGLFGYFFWLTFVGVSAYMLYRLQKLPPPSDNAEGWAEQQRLARMLLFSLLGFLAGAFFLSRSYSMLLYILCALAVAHYQIVRQLWPSVPTVTATAMLPAFFVLEILSIVFMYILVKILL